ncbi:hypothetical protein HHI36_006360 [Cryptolaemus montrouzieri]|uniref:Uncharacterized protein n=1 Tax=Cryptolaemus montrouzieri TaxID=559131 RepID=A0ABD2NXX2_9CUCU
MLCVLGPLLFVVYIHDLPDVFGEVSLIESYFYADHSNLMVKSRNIGTVVQTAKDVLEKTGDWTLVQYFYLYFYFYNIQNKLKTVY